MDNYSKEADGFVVEANDSRLRLQTSVRLRWFAVAGQLLAVVFVHFGLGFATPLGQCVALIAMSAWVNVFLRLRFSPRHRLSPQFATGLLAYDILQLAGLLYLTGGVENPFAFLLVAPVTVSASSLPLRNTVFLGAVALATTGLLVFFHMPLPWYEAESLEIPVLYKFGLLTAVTATLVFLALYAWRLAKEARQMSAALAATELVLAREQRLHALDGLAAAAAHELGTPLATIALVAKELEREVAKDHPYYDDIALLQSQAVRCREILQKLTRRPSEQDPLHAVISVTHLIEEAVEPYRLSRARPYVVAGPGAQVGADPAARKEPVGQRRPGVIYGLGNLIENAVDFAAARVEIKAEWSEREVAIVVSDDGPGFAPGLIDVIGDPYVTTRPSGNADPHRQKPTGLGLGFFIAKTLLERSGATIELANRPLPQTGAVVTITWPRAAFEARDVIWPPPADKASTSDSDAFGAPASGL
ncbi:MAG: hypothetical protein RLZ98_964 [Pseudomonadota bacterium]